MQVHACLQIESKLRSEYLLYSSMSIDPWGLQAWVTSSSNDGGNMKAALSRDTDTREREGVLVVEMVKNQCFAYS